MLDQLLELGDVTILLVLFGVTFLIAWFLSAVYNRGKELKDKGRAASKRTMGCFTTLVLFLLLSLVFVVLAFQRAYSSFTRHQLVAVVQCYPTYGLSPHSFELRMTRMIDGKAAEEQSFILRGDQWSLGGDILEWHSLMNFIGLHSMYRLTRVQSRYIRAEDEIADELSAYALVPDEKSDVWETLYEWAPKLPIIKSAHQNFVVAYPSYGDTFEVYVTPTGYTLERFEERR